MISITALRMSQTQFTNTSQKAYVLKANVTGMNTAKNEQFFCWNLEKQRRAQNIIKITYC